MAALLAEIVQNGFVVADLDEALRHWTQTLGVGPFFRADHLRLARYTWTGQPSDIDLSVAFASAGPLQIELIFQHNDAPSTYRTHLQTKGPGLHHVCHRTAGYDDALLQALANGLVVESEGQILGGVRFCYLSAESPGLPLLELADLSPAAAAMHARVFEASRGWDGTDPVRPLRLGA